MWGYDGGPHDEHHGADLITKDRTNEPALTEYFEYTEQNWTHLAQGVMGGCWFFRLINTIISS